MTRQFIRFCSLSLGTDDGKRLLMSNLRFTFQVTHGVIQTPKTLRVRVYNLSDATAKKIKESADTSITLTAGYDENADEIFIGTIRQALFGRENPTDTYLDLFAATAEAADAETMTSQTFASGWEHTDIQQQCAKDMAIANITAGAFPQISGSGARPKVVYGMTRDVCRVTARSTASVYAINDTKLDFVQPRELSKVGDSESFVVLRPDTGLIGIPIQTPDGVQATCLLNPSIKPKSLVKIYSQNDSGSRTVIQQEQADLGLGINGANQITDANGNVTVAGLSLIGTYRVVYVEHTGDTRGNPYYSTLYCQATDVSTLPSTAVTTSTDT